MVQSKEVALVADPDYAKKDWLPYFDPELVLPDSYVCPPQRDAFPVKPWLDARGGAIKNYIYGPTGEPAWKIIQDAADAVGISRKLLIVTLQREQSLVRASVLEPKKLDKACGQAIFDPRPTDPPAEQQRRAELRARNIGFRNQLYGAAKTYAKRFAEWKAGSSIKVNYSNGENPLSVSDDTWDIRVPKNAATWALLRYTPHDVSSRFTRDQYRAFFGV
jgi:hypothetical protein